MELTLAEATRGRVTSLAPQTFSSHPLGLLAQRRIPPRDGRVSARIRTWNRARNSLPLPLSRSLSFYLSVADASELQPLVRRWLAGCRVNRIRNDGGSRITRRVSSRGNKYLDQLFSRQTVGKICVLRCKALTHW